MRWPLLPFPYKPTYAQIFRLRMRLGLVSQLDRELRERGWSALDDEPPEVYNRWERGDFIRRWFRVSSGDDV